MRNRIAFRRLFSITSLLALVISTIGTTANYVSASTFGTGDTVEVYNTGGVGLLVLDTACGKKIGGKFDGARGEVIDGPVFCSSYNRWRIRCSDGLQGWSAENWLRKISSAPDSTSPKVNSLSVNPGSVNVGNSFTISCSVSDTGGSGLIRIELWRANDSGGLPINWSEVKRNSASGDSYSTSFYDTPSAGTYWYGIHVVDNAGNWSAENTPVKVMVIATSVADTIKPGINSLSVNPGSVNVGNSFTISCSVSDTGGSGLTRVELWRANDSGGSPAGWGEVKRNSASGNSYSTTFYDTPSAGTYWYGIHVVDNAGNWSAENTPVKVMVIATSVADTIKPGINSLSVNPGSVNVGNSFTISCSVSDTGGSGLTRVELWRANDSGGSPAGWGEVKRNSASGNSYSTSFYDTPSAGTYWYGIHVVDNAGNWSAENTPVKVTVMASDATKPTDNLPNVTSLSVSVSEIKQGKSVIISFAVSDDIGLKQVELWRADDTASVGFREINRLYISGKSYSGFFSDIPPLSGTYRYGLHAVDTNGEWNCEKNSRTNFLPGIYGPKEVAVEETNIATPPTVDNPQWTGDFYDDSVPLILARAIFGEARGESDEGRVAVGWVIKNRVLRGNGWQGWKADYHNVILQIVNDRYMFDCFNQDDTNYQSVIDPLNGNNQYDKDAWNKCYEIAGLVLNNQVQDKSLGADHYQGKDLTFPPSWVTTSGRIAIETVVIGKHRFYRVELPGSISPSTITASSVISFPSGQFRAEYFNNRFLSGSPSSVQLEPGVYYDWGLGNPGHGVGDDNFSVRWTGLFKFNAGSYVFKVKADDGIKVWVDNNLIIDEWKDQAATSYSQERFMTAGEHEVKVEYYDSGRHAVAQVKWEPSATATYSEEDTEWLARLLQGVFGDDLTLSDKGAEFIARHEGLKEKPYNDSQGNCTVGVGHLLHMGPCNGTEAELSTGETLDLFKKDAAASVQVVNKMVTVNLTQPQFDALVSFVYNIGEGNFAKSDLLKKLNAGDYASVPAEFDRWHIPPEIISRRDDERELFTSGRY